MRAHLVIACVCSLLLACVSAWAQVAEFGTVVERQKGTLAAWTTMSTSPAQPGVVNFVIGLKNPAAVPVSVLNPTRRFGYMVEGSDGSRPVKIERLFADPTPPTVTWSLLDGLSPDLSLLSAASVWNLVPGQELLISGSFVVSPWEHQPLPAGLYQLRIVIDPNERLISAPVTLSFPALPPTAAAVSEETQQPEESRVELSLEERQKRFVATGQ